MDPVMSTWVTGITGVIGSTGFAWYWLYKLVTLAGFWLECWQEHWNTGTLEQTLAGTLALAGTELWLERTLEPWDEHWLERTL